MRQAAGQIADGFHFLRLSKTLLGLFAVGHIFDKSYEILVCIIGAANDEPLGRDDSYASARHFDGMFVQIEWMGAFQYPLISGVDCGGSGFLKDVVRRLAKNVPAR